ncbi:FAD-dependent oxidoreductase [Acinetobacter nosocomialis]|uniref:flavin monoamine oxidase family protein n=1 Tax=Acinetobacter calcoaceticus/baumannii complex TaxID=909768 RepID=UPI0018DDBBE3|nr:MULTISPECIES: FAD-dependent oxidoreductase [Acinetobacter calcoaceticus/baumannii complex]MDO7209493.1 FAD-dependent oxidoreductase [Acinetobacter nosocomialis]QPV60852.1 FAD-dependent oxidoreductase [Acinetobacter seifertii]
MIKSKIIIIGGGLSGLYAAYLLEQANFVDYLLLEARDRLGGRIFSSHGFDLGATWIWPEMNSQLIQLVNELNLPFFEQDENGDLLIEQSREAPLIRLPNNARTTPSIRLKGGMNHLIYALKQKIPANKIIMGQEVTDLICHKKHEIEVITQDHTGLKTTYQTYSILLAIPPRLASHKIKFTPALPLSISQQWQETATWMAPHAKYIAIYPEPFWKQDGLSGQVRSNLGPLVEIHDASIPNDQAALFGFLGIPSVTRHKIDKKDLFTDCQAQLVRLFGNKAKNPQLTFLKDWSTDLFTSTKADWMNSTSTYSFSPDITSTTSLWDDQIIGIASEWSKQYSGYLAGAIDAAIVGVLHHLKNNRNIFK